MAFKKQEEVSSVSVRTMGETINDSIVSATFINQRGNVAATARSLGVNRQTIMSVLGKKDVHESLMAALKERGVDIETIATKLKEGLEADITIFPFGRDPEKVADYKTRHIYLTSLMKLAGLNLTGINEIKIEEEVLITDEQLHTYIKALEGVVDVDSEDIAYDEE